MFLLIKRAFCNFLIWLNVVTQLLKLHVHFFPSHEPFVIRYFKVPHFSEFKSVKQN